MSAPDAPFIISTLGPRINFGLEPAFNAFHSLLLLVKANHLSGLDEWVTRTDMALAPERRYLHHIVFSGLYHAIEPARSWSSFPLFVDDLARQEPEALKDRLFEAYFRHSPKTDEAQPGADQALPSATQLLADRKLFLAFLRERFGTIEEDIESEAHALLNDPPKMKEVIVAHLRYMWTSVMAPEWERITPLLQTCVDAYRQIDFGGLSNAEVVQEVIGHEPDDHLQKMLPESDRVVFVPSAHLGPYLGRFKINRVLYVLFGARQPQGAAGVWPDLSRSELLVRLTALADDTRLRILHLIAQNGEQCSPDIIRELDLSQSAASRHLQQLTATGYLVERRHEGAKCYNLSADRIEDTFRALSKFVQNSNAGS